MVSVGAHLAAVLRREPASGWLAAYVFVWTVIPVVAATTAFIALRGESLRDWISIATIMFGFFYAWAVIALLIIWGLIRFPLKRRNFLAVGSLHLLFLVVVSVLMPFLIHGGDWREWLYGSRAVGWHSLNAIIYSFVLIGFQMFQYYRLGLLREREAQKAELRSVQLENDLSQARINTLRMQMNPHFLFNSLNSISSLIAASNNTEAFRMTGLLGSLLREALERERTSFTSLAEELGFLQKYVEIEKIRFGRRLSFSCAVPEHCLEYQVPSLMLQPIVENAIKHAVAPATGPVEIELRASRAGNELHFEIADNGSGFSHPVAFGCGLKNVNERLALLFGADATLDISNGPSGGALVRMKVPVVGATQAAPGAIHKEKRQLAN